MIASNKGTYDFKYSYVTTNSVTGGPDDPDQTAVVVIVHETTNGGAERLEEIGKEEFGEDDTEKVEIPDPCPPRVFDPIPMNRVTLGGPRRMPTRLASSYG